MRKITGDTWCQTTNPVYSHMINMEYNPTSYFHYLRFLDPPNRDHPDAQIRRVWQHCKYGKWKDATAILGRYYRNAPSTYYKVYFGCSIDLLEEKKWTIA